MGGIEILPVGSPAELDRFIKLPARLYAGDPAFVAPLVMERREALSPTKNPYFAHAETQFWLARRDGRDVGRISAQIDRLVTDPDVGHFGMIVAEDDAEVFAALFAAAEGWLRARGKRRIMGPFNLSINEETGLLIDGFDAPPVMLMGHDPRYAGPRIEALGYAKAKDLIAYMYDIDHELPAAARRKIDSRKATALTVRRLDMQRYREEFDTVTAIFNDAWSQNYGFVPFTVEEFNDVGKLMTLLLPDDYVQIAEVDGEPAAFIVAMPNINEVTAGLRGRLLPLGWLRLLWGLKVRHPQSARVPLMGVRKKFQQSRLGPGLAFMVIDAVRKGLCARGVREVELSWILEDNSGMRSIIEAIGGQVYKRYRIYEKAI